MLFVFFMLISSFPAIADDLLLEFQHLSLHLQTSPVGQYLIAQRDARISEYKATLQWSNPELEVEQEMLQSHLENERETVVAFGKTMSTPWSGSSHRNMRRHQLRAVDYDYEQLQRQVLADWKTLYVEIQLKSELQNRLSEFEDMVETVSQIAMDRHEQGTLSGLENQLIQMSQFNVKASMLHLHSELYAQKNHFKRQLGLDVQTPLLLQTQIPFVRVALPEALEKNQLTESPLLNAQKAQRDAQQHHVAFEKGNILPELHVAAGYKNVNNELKGGVVSVSVPLPILNQNRAAIQKAKSDLAAARINVELTEIELQHRIQEYSALVDEAQWLLNRYAEKFQSTKLMSGLVFSFQEGWLTLSDLLSGIQVYADALESYYTHLAHYYGYIFQLEVITGQTLVQF